MAGIPTPTAGETIGTSIPLYSSPAPTRTGHTFAGWCSNTTADNGTTCNGESTPTYTPGSDFYIDQTTTNNTTLYAVWTPNPYTCTKQYRLQNADGTYPDAYTSAGTEQVNFGVTCNYEQAIADYTTQSTSGTMTVGGITLSLDLPRTTYVLTVDKNTAHISSVTGAGTYRWGEIVSISATANSNSKFKTWSQTAGTASSFGNAISISSTFTMPKSDATIYADGETNIIYIQDFTISMCRAQASSSNVTVIDKRDGNTYTVRYIRDACWMTQNLQYLGDTGSSTSRMIIKTTTTNVDTDKTLNYYSFSGSGSDYCSIDSVSLYLCVQTDGSTTWYNYVAASAGTITGYMNNANATYDICPKGWSLPVGKSTAAGGTNTLFTSANAFQPTLDGYYNGSVISGKYSESFWWSATAKDYWERYALRCSGGGSLSNELRSRNDPLGFLIRCVRTS